MTPERWAKIEEIFQAALDCPPPARASFVEKQCSDDAEMLAEVENLINSYDTGNPFLESPIWDDRRMLQTTLGQEIASSLERETDESLVGQQIGAYRLTEEIGRGGMGVVFLATRDEDFRQKVTLKIVKRGWTPISFCGDFGKSGKFSPRSIIRTLRACSTAARPKTDDLFW